jgi:hypothetical protein
MKAVERGAPAAAIFAALSALACCLPFGIIGAVASQASVSGLHPFVRGFSAAVLLLALGFWQLYRRGTQCNVRCSRLSVALFWLAVVVLLFVTVFPQLIANWLAG